MDSDLDQIVEENLFSWEKPVKEEYKPKVKKFRKIQFLKSSILGFGGGVLGGVALGAFIPSDFHLLNSELKELAASFLLTESASLLVLPLIPILHKKESFKERVIDMYLGTPGFVIGLYLGYNLIQYFKR